MIFLLSGLVMSGFRSYDPAFNHHWVKNGASAATLVKRGVNLVHITFTPTSANGGTYDLSSLGINTIVGHEVSIEKSVNSIATDVPNVATRSLTNTTYTYDIVQGSSSVVSVLGLSVLQGPAQIYATPLSNIKIHLKVYWY